MTAFMPKHRADQAVRPAHHITSSGALLRAVALALLISFSSVAVAGAQESTPEASPAATPSPTMPRLELDLEELNDSGISGTVTLYDAGDQTIVEFDVEGAGGDHPTHIHAGVCGELEPEPAYPLDNVDENGESTTVVDATLDDLLAEDHAIDMHLAPNELGTLIACADIDGEPELPEGATPEASPEATPAETPTEAVTPTVISDGTGGAVPTEPAVAVATETEAAADQTIPAPTEAAPTPAPTEEPTSVPTEIPAPAPTEATTPVDSLPSGKGDVSDGTGGPGSTAPVAADSPMPPVSSTGDGTAGVSGKGDPVSATTLPQQAGVGSALTWPDNPAMAMMWATTVAAVILGSSAWIIRRGERSTMTPSSRWTRMGI